MRNLIYFIGIGLLFLIVASCQSNNNKSYWDNGKVKSELKYKDDKLDGESNWFYENGKLQMSAEYEDNKLNGSMKRWHENGNLQSISYYKDNKLDSLFLTFSVNGVKIGSEYYVNGQLEGPYYKWYESGQIMLEGQYKQNMMDGSWLFFLGDGSIAAKANFVLGTGVQKAYHENGTVSMIIHYKDNEKHGKEEYFSPKGVPSLTRIYDNGMLIEEIEHPY